MPVYDKVISLTFGDQAENHAGMQKIGIAKNKGYTYTNLKKIKEIAEKRGLTCEMNKLHDVVDDSCKEKAYLLIIRNGVKLFHMNADSLYDEHIKLDHDKKALMRGRVVNKHARYNLCYADYDQDPDYEKGKGRVVDFSSVPILNALRMLFPVRFGNKADNLVAELNLYYDLNNCGIGFHGDTERKIVICVRLGATMGLEYQWHYKNEPVFARKQFVLNHGDIYIMSDKAVGHDWKKSSIYTLRHGAGSAKYVK